MSVTPPPSQATGVSLPTRICFVLVALLMLYRNAPPLLHALVREPISDVARFFAGLETWEQTGNLYAHHPKLPMDYPADLTLDGLPRHITLWNMNPPVFHLPLLALWQLPGNVALSIWQLAGIASLVVAFRVGFQAANVAWTPMRILAVCFCCFLTTATPAVVLNEQVTWLLLVPVTLMWQNGREGRWFWAGLWLGVLISLKLFFLLFIPFLILERHWRGLAGASVSIVLLGAAGALVFGLENHRNWVGCLAQVDEWSWMSFNASLWGLLSRGFAENPSYVPVVALSGGALKVVWVLLGGAMGLLTLGVIYRDRTPERLDRAFALLLVGCVLFSPLGWNYYYWLALPPLIPLFVGWLQAGTLQRPWLVGLLLLAVPGLGWMPALELSFFDPGVWLTLTLASVFTWTTLAVWLALILDGVFPNEKLASDSASVGVVIYS